MVSGVISGVISTARPTGLFTTGLFTTGLHDRAVHDVTATALGSSPG